MRSTETEGNYAKKFHDPQGSSISLIKLFKAFRNISLLTNTYLCPAKKLNM